jgi:hypothetical protein
MLHRTDLRVLTVLGGAIGIIAACTSSGGGGTSSSGGTSGSSNGTSGSSNGTSGSGTSGSGTSDSGPAECTGEVGQACFDCCGESDQTFDEADKAYDNCACVRTECNTECGVYCAERQSNPSAEPNEACQTCLESDVMAAACDPQFLAKCESLPHCKKVTDCVSAAKCSDDDGG